MVLVSSSLSRKVSFTISPLGKSNLMDAISFVLGVNSNQLRSSHLVDLINRKSDAEIATQATPNTSGRGKRGNSRMVKEQSALKATVSAYYLKSNGKDEIVFSRSVNSTGASEYKVNGDVVPFSEYNDILESENVLIKARNFLVFQGDVEDIASKSPKDMSKLIEQISGSDELKDEYDRLKNIQDKAIEASTFAFNKKRTLANEIKAVQDQKDDAVRYEQVVLQRMDLISEQIVWKLFHVENAAKEFDRRVDALKKELDTAEGVVEEREAQVKTARKQHAKVQKDALTLSKQVKKAQADVDSLAPEALTLDEKHRFVTSRLKTLKAAQVKQMDAIERHATDISVVGKELREVEGAFKAFESNSAVQEAAMNKLTSEQMVRYRELMKQATTESAKEHLKLEGLENKIAPTVATVKHREEKLFENNVRRKQLQADRVPLQASSGELRREADQVKAECKSTQRELAHMLAERTRLQQQEVEASEKLRGVMEKLLEAKIDRQESERELKLRATVESLKRMFSGVLGRLVDLCQPANKKYDLALSIVLGRNMDAIVVDCEQTAIDCIQYMRQQRSGHATFIPLDSIKARPVPDKYRTFVSGVRPAIDIVNFDAQYTRAFQYACGSALVCDTLEVAKYVCYEKDQRVKAVTLDGSVIHKSGFLTGGSSSHASNSKGGKQGRWEEKQVAQLKQDRDRILSVLSDAGKSLKRLENDQKLRTALTEKEARAQYLQEEMQALVRRLDAVDAELAHLDEEDAVIGAEIAEMQRSMQKSRQDIAAVQEQIYATQERVFAQFCKDVGLDSIRAFEEARAASQKDLADKTAKFATLIAKLSNQSTFIQKQQEDAKARVADLNSQMEAEQEALQSLDQEKKVIDDQLASKRSVLNGVKAKMADLDASIAAANEETNAFKRAVTEAQADLTRIRKGIAAAECEIERRLETRNSLLKKCLVEEIDLPLARGSLHDISVEDSDASAAAGIVVDFSVLGRESRARSDDSFEQSYYQSKIRLLQEDIDRLVPNLRALDKLDSVEQRLKSTMEGFETARLDAKKARDEFLAVKARRTRLFTAAFRHISEAIDPIYKELTRSEAVPTGGTAYLSLEDGDEPYLEGIKFHAMPPMKRFLDMEQLSGGEKTVAALALLFAIHSFRPAPFFILDEIDAALDNANVQRVAAFIRSKATAATQFIVISLKGGLYERAESLIGIYKDPEVRGSRVLSLRLTDYPETAN